jgi:N-acetylglucosamine malate deacetylase 1
MLQYFKRALILSPHTDDGEFGCGATINRLVNTGCEVYYMAFSACQQSVLPQFPPDILVSEVKAATKELGIKPENLFLYDYEVRTFNKYRQEILDDILVKKKEIKPDVVFMPSVNDIHQDHFVVANEGVRAFKWNTILCYELPWNNFNFNTCCFVSVENEHIDAKLRALNMYESQKHRPYSNTEFIKGLAKTRGVQSGNNYAETFEVVRLSI